MILSKTTSVSVDEVTSREEVAEMQARLKRFRKNSDWLQANLPEVYAKRPRYERAGSRPHESIRRYR